MVDSNNTKFINETTQFLDRVETTVHALMLNMGNQELQRELYQQIRTLAKYSKDLKQDKFAAIAQYIQGVLKRLIDGKYTNNQVTTGVLFEGVNILKGLVDELASGKAFLSIEEIIQKLTPTENDSFLPHATVSKEPTPPANESSAEQKTLLVATPIPHDDLLAKAVEPSINFDEIVNIDHSDTISESIADEPINIDELVGEYEEALRLTQDSKVKVSLKQSDDVDVNSDHISDDPIDSFNINYQNVDNSSVELEFLSPASSLPDVNDTVNMPNPIKYEETQPLIPIHNIESINTKPLTTGKFSNDTTLEKLAELNSGIDPEDSAHILSDDKYNRDYFNRIAQKYQKTFSYELPPIERGIDSIKRLLRYKINNENEVASQLSGLLGDVSLSQNKLELIASLVNHELGDDSELSHVLMKTANQLRGLTDQMLDVVMHDNLTPFKVAFARIPRIVRDYTKAFDKEIDFIIDADGVMIDRRVVTKIYEPLLYVIRNALRFFTEDTQDKVHPRIILSAQTYGDDIVIKLRDNGYGINVEKVKAKAIAANIITIDEATKLSENTAYGLVFLLGLTLGEDPKEDKLGDLLNRNIIAVNGIVNFLSSTDTRLKKVLTEDRYTEFQLLVPILGITTHVLFIEVANYIMAVPFTNIIDILKVSKLDDLEKIRQRGKISIGSGKDYAEVPTVNLAEVLGLNSSKSVAKNSLNTTVNVTQVEQVIQDRLSGERDTQEQGDGVGTYIIVASVGRRAALLVDKIITEDRVVIKSMSSAFGSNKGFLGAAIAQGDKVRLVININDIFDLAPTFPRHTYFRVQDKLSFKRSLKL